MYNILFNLGSITNVLKLNWGLRDWTFGGIFKEKEQHLMGKGCFLNAHNSNLCMFFFFSFFFSILG